jgi:type II secretory ATPase GspE/PulE/Tfp pilus assembly ATPase PilB-like protein
MPSVNEVKYLHLDSSESFVKGEGCEHCLGTGYYGRAGIFETMLIDESLQNMIFENVSTSEIRSHLKQKKASGLRIDGLYKARMGWTTLEEVLRVTPLDAENLGKD